ncbi:MAG TPA: DNA polymerase Y family protein, partial [Dongiaceae bacterium]|nr:DNA polymerase Y family protein [Dongiaceae bacterium]
HFPVLALNRVEQTLPVTRPLVIEINQRQRRLVWQANAAASAVGIEPGMTIPAAQGLCCDLLCVPRDEPGEQETLRQLGDWAYRFTPHIQMHNGNSLLLEVGHSLRLFGGREALAQQLCDQLPAGFQPYGLAFCDTAFSALLLAQVCAQMAATGSPPLTDTPFFSLHHLLPQSVYELDVEDAQIELLKSMGILTLEQLFALPTDALAKRFGQSFLTYLGRLRGTLPDLLPAWQLPVQFQARREFLHELETTDQLLFPLRALLSHLQDYLVARQLATTELRFNLELRNRATQPWTLALAAPHYRSEQMLPLLQLKLATLQLSAPVLALSLGVESFVPLPAGQLDLLTPWQSDNVDRQQLVDKLKARLGDSQVFGLTMLADHRPEKSWAPCAPGTGNIVQHPSERRPFWLLTIPQPLRDKKGLPLHEGELELLRGPERIHSGWWDGEPVNRDYFVARQRNGRQLWIYRERTDQRWFLHGIFEG